MFICKKKRKIILLSFSFTFLFCGLCVLSRMINAINLTTFYFGCRNFKIKKIKLYRYYEYPHRGQREEEETQIKKKFAEKKITNSRWVHSWTAAFHLKAHKVLYFPLCASHLHILFFMYIIQKELIIQSFIWDKITNYKEKKITIKITFITSN